MKGESIMPFEILNFRDSDKIIKEKNLAKDIQVTLEYINDVLYGAVAKRELLRQALEEMDWRQNAEDLVILEGRRYRYKGFKKRVALEGSFGAYEYILEGLLRLQIGFDKKKIDCGILFLNSFRSEKTPYGSSKELAKAEVVLLQPTITVPVTIALFDLGSPQTAEE